MKIHRFFIADEPVGDRYVIQDEGVAHQIQRVLRLRKGEHVALVSGTGIQFIGEIVELGKQYVSIQIIRTESVWMPTTEVTVYMAQIRKERFEWGLEKCTELGVSRIVPLITAHTERGVVNTERARKILMEAAEQCGRGSVPEFGEPVGIEAALFSCSVPIVCDFGGRDPEDVIRELHGVRGVQLFVGPEGGWEDHERALFAKGDVPVVSLGSTTLRAETAAVVACAFFRNV
jgi:16S rRNA (uracil1498-N3)-methyltransferase